MHLLSCEHLTMQYDGRNVVHDISFFVDPGDYLCIVGENGSGKSTLMRGVLGLKPLSGGSVEFGEGLRRQEIGYLPQQTAVQREFPTSVEEVVRSGLLNRCGMLPFYRSQARKQADAIMDRLELTALRHRSFRALSGGQQQRVLLARALCATKKLLLLDEPVTGLDPIASGEMYNLIKLINLCDNISVIMVSHDIHEAVRYATHILHLGHSQLFFGTAAEYRQSSLARRFLGGGQI